MFVKIIRDKQSKEVCCNIKGFELFRMMRNTREREKRE